MKRALLLNATYEPLNFITEHRAISLLLKGRAEVVVNMDGKQSLWCGVEFRSPSRRVQLPATLRLIKRVKCKKRHPQFRKKVLFNRDSWTCQYCGCNLTPTTAEVEHIVPSSRGGKSSWLNCVSACRSCNKRKANRTPEEAGMRLLRAPRFPSSLHFWDITRSRAIHPDWSTFVASD